MKDIRIGNDIKVKWSLYADEDPFNLERRNVRLFLKAVYGKRELKDFTISGNTITWTFFGKDQKSTGRYSLELVLNDGVEGMITTDACDFVELVSCSLQASGFDAPGVHTESIDLVSNVEIGVGGVSISPDWNAAEGQEGHILNRTHYHDNPIEENIYEESGLAWGDIREIYPYGHKYYKITIDGESQIIDFVGKGWPQYDFEKEEQNKLEYDLQFNDVGLRVSFFENGGYERMIVVEYYPMDSAAPETIDVSITDYYVDFKQLDEEYIPDTIARQADVTKLQNTKIDKEADDYYPQLSVGTADNLSGVDEVDSEFSFRRSGGGAIADGVARVQSIKGNSVVWNQLNEKFYFTEDRAMACREGVSITKGHKYLLLRTQTNGGCYLLPKPDFYDYSLANGVSYKFFTSEIDCVSSGVMPTYPHLYCTAESGYVQIVNLTKMFGAGNEPSTIEEYNARKPFVEDEYVYNEGEVIHMTAEGIKSVGVNAWDEEWENGTINLGNGMNETSPNNIRSKNFTKVLSGHTYHFLGTFAVVYYDKDKNFVDWFSIGVSRELPIPQNVEFIKICTTTGNVNTYKNDICINISNADANGKYYPYTENAEDLSIVAKYFPNGMRSAGAAHDEIRYNKASNKWEKVVRVGEVDLGSLSYGKSGIGDNAFYTTSLQNKVKKEGRMMSAKFYLVDGITDTSKFLMSVDSVGTLYFNCPPITDVASFTNAMSGVMLYYELAKPIVTEIKEKDFNLDYKVWNCGTEQMVASKPSSALSADITYGFNAVGLIKQLRSMLEALSAKVANL